MTWTIVVAYCIIDDLLNPLGHRDDPQRKTPASLADGMDTGRARTRL